MLNTKFKVMVTSSHPGQRRKGTKEEASTGGLNSAGDVLFLTLDD